MTHWTLGFQVMADGNGARRAKKAPRTIMSTSTYIPREINLQLEALVSKLRKRTITDPMEVALSTSFLLRVLINSSKSNDAKSLIETVRSFGARMVRSIPNGNVFYLIGNANLHVELVVGNIVRRTLHIIREEYHVQTKDINQEQSDYSLDVQDFKVLVLDGIKEMIDELETQATQIANQAVEFVHSHQIILTLGYSRTVLQFLQKAGKTRRFQVFVCENAPMYV
jgi:translation initiation factor eIF-2B subunit beta